ncbi:hypothetical protein EVAR_31334_1 [Eumeta japonica]|uniref:Uncharacterized protein n=1 Tax=Eumeta variegata TaxID=151549 RepID=A0A4C1Y052_EUMVA|nr:hypothetical protein EVAR_31334_1 [Eumeta japonica]
MYNFVHLQRGFGLIYHLSVFPKNFEKTSLRKERIFQQADKVILTRLGSGMSMDDDVAGSVSRIRQTVGVANLSIKASQQRRSGGHASRRAPAEVTITRSCDPAIHQRGARALPTAKAISAALSPLPCYLLPRVCLTELISTTTISEWAAVMLRLSPLDSLKVIKVEDNCDRFRAVIALLRYYAVTRSEVPVRSHLTLRRPRREKRNFYKPLYPLALNFPDRKQ